MAHQYDAQWNAILGIIEPETSSVSYNTWFKDTKLVDVIDNTMLVSVKNEFNKEILSTRYLELIKNCTLQVLSKEYNFDFVVISEDGKYEPKNSSSTIKKEHIDDPLNTKSNLNPRYVFNSFVVGNSNR
ncbi:MAG: DnaA N-terminal domain-containing protein, partial [Cellulosilyticaceae bacterium]